MLAKIFSTAIIGVDASIIEIEVDSHFGLPGTIIIGLPDTSVKESKDRIKSAILNSGFKLPSKKTTINLAPADIKKEGTHFDLPIAVGLLAATNQIKSKNVADFLFIGELSLDGKIRPVKGILSTVMACQKNGIKNIILPKENSRQASVIKDVCIYPVETLLEVFLFLNNQFEIIPIENSYDTFNHYEKNSDNEIDFSEIKGQFHVRRAMEIAVAGGHNILMIGPPGSGKTMLAQRIPTIMPLLNIQEAIETTKVYSAVSSQPIPKGLINQPPFRAPHHTISTMGLIGGGSIPQPGEISLAHNGVLFLDELPEFNRSTLEVLRQPLESGYVNIARAKQSLTFPSRFMLVCAMNPCPCGYLTDKKKNCQCSSYQIQKYLSKISGPLLDRIDIHIEVGPVSTIELQSSTTAEHSEEIRKRIERARLLQSDRYKEDGIILNAQLKNKELKKYCPLDSKTNETLKIASEQMQFSARAYNKIIKIARTIADIENCENILIEHIAEAIQYRSLDTVYNNVV